MADIKLCNFKNGYIYIKSNVDEVETKPTKFWLFFSQDKKQHNNAMIFIGKIHTNFYAAEDSLEDFKEYLLIHLEEIENEK